MIRCSLFIYKYNYDQLIEFVRGVRDTIAQNFDVRILIEYVFYVNRHASDRAELIYLRYGWTGSESEFHVVINGEVLSFS